MLRLALVIATDAALLAEQALAIWTSVFVLGLVQDLLIACVLSILLLLAWIMGPKSTRLMLILLLGLVLIVSAAELFFWHEFESRLDRLVFHYLAYPQEVAHFLQDQFRLVWLVLPFGLLLWLCYRGFTRWLPLANQPKTTSRMLWVAVTGGLIGSVLVLYYPPSWSVNNVRTLNQLASNGYLGILQAARINAAHWHPHYWQPGQEAVTDSASVQVPPPTLEPLGSIRHVVLIIEESFAGPTWQNPILAEQYLPNFTALQKQSLSFRNIYATGSRTTRGQEALLNGFPPLPGIAASQRLGNHRLPSLPRALAAKGFHTKFVYAGWPNFSGFTDYWSNIGFAESTSRYDFSQVQGQNAFETSWGYADEFLFARLLSEMDQLTEQYPGVFVTALTLSHHRPYDYPAGRIDFPADERRSEYAMAYADWALGEFFRAAATKPWFAQTLFVIAADHGAKFHGAAPIPITSYRVPLLFYAPEHLPAQDVHQLGSLISVPKTLLAMLGHTSQEAFFGHNLLVPAPPLVPVEHNYNVGLLTETQLTVLHRGGGLSGWRLVDTAVGYQEVAPDLTTAAQAAGLFESAHKAFYRPVQGQSSTTR